MASPFFGKKILLGVCGGIAAYRVCDWARAMLKEGAEVTVMMTDSAQRFVTPLTFAALTGRPVYSEMFAETGAERIPHIRLARENDYIVIAPATAKTISRLAAGDAENFLTSVVLAFRGKVIVAPAMNCAMYEHPATQRNLSMLREYGYVVLPPAIGLMACGEEGPGRLPDWEAVHETLITLMLPQDLAGLSVLVTAGPTREPLDPVRFLGNPASGRMGFAIAIAARRRGAEVTLVSGPTELTPPSGVEFVPVTTAEEMREAVLGRKGHMQVIVKAAAVSDFRPEHVSSRKVKKNEGKLSLTLARNPDILLELGSSREPGAPPLLVGFAAESHDHLEEGQRKLQEKRLDLMVVNDITQPDAGFAVNTNRVTILDRDGGINVLPLLSKEEVANRIWDEVRRLLH